MNMEIYNYKFLEDKVMTNRWMLSLIGWFANNRYRATIGSWTALTFSKNHAWNRILCWSNIWSIYSVLFSCSISHWTKSSLFFFCGLRKDVWYPLTLLLRLVHPSLLFSSPFQFIRWPCIGWNGIAREFTVRFNCLLLDPIRGLQ